MKLTTVKYIDISEVSLRKLVKELDALHELPKPPATATLTTTDTNIFFRVPLEFQKVDQETLFGDGKEGDVGLQPVTEDTVDGYDETGPHGETYGPTEPTHAAEIPSEDL